MNILLDSHVMLWVLEDHPDLSSAARKILTDSNNQVFYSPLSIFELELKRLKHPDESIKLAEQIIDGCQKAGLKLCPVSDIHVAFLEGLQKPEELEHKDPFDRLLLCQAKAEGMALMTHDTKLTQYNEKCIIRV